jgi:hypothetical protein
MKTCRGWGFLRFRYSSIGGQWHCVIIQVVREKPVFKNVESGDGTCDFVHLVALQMCSAGILSVVDELCRVRNCMMMLR